MLFRSAYAVYSAKEKAKSSVSDFKRGMVQEQQSRQTGRLEKQEQHRQNIADKRMELQKAQEARQRKTDGSATTGATRPHERPVTASTIPKPSAEKMQEVKRPATATTSKASEPVKTNVVKERPLSSGASDKKATQPALCGTCLTSYMHVVKLKSGTCTVVHNIFHSTGEQISCAGFDDLCLFGCVIKEYIAILDRKSVV